MEHARCSEDAQAPESEGGGPVGEEAEGCGGCGHFQDVWPSAHSGSWATGTVLVGT